VQWGLLCPCVVPRADIFALLGLQSSSFRPPTSKSPKEDVYISIKCHQSDNLSNLPTSPSTFVRWTTPYTCARQWRAHITWPNSHVQPQASPVALIGLTMGSTKESIITSKNLFPCLNQPPSNILQAWDMPTELARRFGIGMAPLSPSYTNRTQIEMVDNTEYLDVSESSMLSRYRDCFTMQPTFVQ
jgi:hypothetical protein